MATPKKAGRGSGSTCYTMACKYHTESQCCASSTCVEYMKRGTCEHCTALQQNMNVWTRIRSFGSRRVERDSDEADDSVWSYVQYSNLEYDDVDLFHIFRRRFLSSSLRTSAAVVIEKKQSRLNLGLIERIRCGLWFGAAHKREPCIHESTCFN